jgi:hypothetical protein
VIEITGIIAETKKLTPKIKMPSQNFLERAALMMANEFHLGVKSQ